MSRFYGEVKGSAKTIASRRGFNSIESHTRGWERGIKVSCFVDNNNNEVYEVYKTGGSHNPDKLELIYSEIYE